VGDFRSFLSSANRDHHRGKRLKNELNHKGTKTQNKYTLCLGVFVVEDLSKKYTFWAMTL